ncbi:hypothetical protein [Bradyrhizobium sp. dw_78]|uniref:hypothetical protein n=1 Tax=Bradyrhizobium sp. dw_78 TaxID=2719793 RepID=UPI001BD5CD0E|nr:hypothetical protein [Bradyrhizobium sp. dw_78]
MPIGATIGAAGAVGGALINSNASQQASQQQVAMQQQALQQQQQMFGVAQNALNPFISAGQSVLPTLQGLITPGANQNALLSQTPGFQFSQQYGNIAATNALAAHGLGASAGPVATALSQYNQGLAQNTWGATVNALQGFAGLGGNAANAMAGNALASGNAQAATLTGIGNAQAAGTLGSANALAGGLTGATNALSSAALFNYMSNGGLNNAGLYGGLSGPAYGGGNALTDAWGGSPTDPLSGLTSADYGI